MKKDDAYRKFIRLWLIALATILNITICFAIGISTQFSAIVVTVLLLINVFILVYNLVSSVTEGFKHTFDKSVQPKNVFYGINMFVSVVMNTLFGFFYFTLLSQSISAIIG